VRHTSREISIVILNSFFSNNRVKVGRDTIRKLFIWTRKIKRRIALSPVSFVIYRSASTRVNRRKIARHDRARIKDRDHRAISSVRFFPFFIFFSFIPCSISRETTVKCVSVELCARAHDFASQERRMLEIWHAMRESHARVSVAL